MGDNFGSVDRYSAGALPVSTAATFKYPGMSKEASHSSEDSEDIQEGHSLEDASTSDDEDPIDNSPYPQARAWRPVSAVENATLSVNSLRMWTLSILCAVSGLIYESSL